MLEGATVIEPYVNRRLTAAHPIFRVKQAWSQSKPSNLQINLFSSLFLLFTLRLCFSSLLRCLASYVQHTLQLHQPVFREVSTANEPFRREAVLQLPKDRCGLYALWLPTGTEDAPERLYVGESTTCVRRRLLQHLSDEENPELRKQLHLFRDIVQFSVVFTEGRQETLALETTLIRELQPETNRYKLKPRKD